jgi:transketolase C-terminal domain/subunit
MLRQSLAIADQMGSQFANHFQRFQVVAADLAGHIAAAAGLALEGNILEPFVIADAAVYESQRNRVSAPCGVALKVVVADAGAAPGKPPAFHQIKRDPLAVRTLAAPFRFCQKILQSHYRFIL